MKSKNQMGEVIIYVDDYEFFTGSSYLCRICHDEEFESCKNLEAPCACSGTVKYAHRDCIQRWCNEKGNTICEICLQKFEPGYTAPPPKKAHLVDNNTAANAIIRGNVETDIENGRERVESSDSEDGREILVRSQYSECSQAADRSASFCRTIALVFTILLMMRHLLEVLNGGARNYPFTLPTLLIIRSTGILLPMYIILLLITRIQIIIRHHYLDSQDRLSNSDQDT